MLKKLPILSCLLLSFVLTNCGKSSSKSTPPAADIENIPAAGANDASFQAESDALMGDAARAWLSHGVSVSVESDIPYEHRRETLKTIIAAASRQDLLDEIKRLKIQVFQVSSTNAIYVNSYHNNEVTLTWKLNQTADLMVSYLQSQIGG